jgi:hypothetical protein
MPYGFEVETPSIFYWFKAGVAFTFGAGCIYVAFGVTWLYLIAHVPSLIFVRALAHF